ncbi:MAG TPA: S41 family peptidase [Allosphingosinicella sp.]|nr:S41 family peptidase [Allosphingosinicella sp.]
MANNFLRSLLVVSALAMVPPAAGAFAAADNDTVREFDEFMTVFNRIRSDYVEQVDDKKLIRGAIDGMLSSLDPHSSYLDERGYQGLMTTTDGEYGGLGLNVTLEDGVVKVIAPTEDSPGDKAGIKAGDYITHLNGKLIYGGALDESVDQMRGAPGTSIKLTIVRPGRDKPFDVSVTRALIHLAAVKWEVKDNVGIINVNSFSRDTTDEALAAIASIERSLGHPPLGYIVDLRSNPGGLLDQAVGLSDVFLERGEVVSQRGRNKSDIERYYAQPGDAARGLPVIVLVDSGTASAAEIVAAALQDHHRAIVMGERSFGKGSVQNLIILPGQTAIRLTTARYYTPSGRSVQEGGIAPDIEVPQLSDPDYKTRPRFRESDLRRHLINEVSVENDVLQDDGKPDPRFASTAEELKRKGIEDYQLHYALQAITRLGGSQTAAAPARRTGTR